MPFRAQIAKLTGEVKTLKFKIEQQSTYNERARRQHQIIADGINDLSDNPLSRDPQMRSVLANGRVTVAREQAKLDSFLGEMMAEYQGKLAELEQLIEFQTAEETSTANEMDEIRSLLDELKGL